LQVCWIPIFKAKKLILAGDPKQLPPTVRSLSPSQDLASRSKSRITSRITGARKNFSGIPNTVPQHGGLDGGGDNGNEPDSVETEDSASSDIPGFTSKMASSVRRCGLMPPRTLELTMFERLEKMYGPRIKCMLTVQYRYVTALNKRYSFRNLVEHRMHAKIAEFPSKVMYDSRLITHSSVATHLLRHLPGITATSEDLQDILEVPITFFDTAGCEYFERVEGDNDEGSRCNENEATIVHKWVATLVRPSASAGHLGLNHL
jgi:DNA polymerase alpha-associated DNA helicase A